MMQNIKEEFSNIFEKENELIKGNFEPMIETRDDWEEEE